ncbi:MAG: hypothetical protein JNK02_01635 [Planctomycetes bacterium]|nr:hypothetical protein [Planctomycetota bacterium]
MRARRVRWAARAFTLALVGAAALVAWRAGRPPPTPVVGGAVDPPASAEAELDGRALHARYCVRCHAVDAFDDALRASNQGEAVLDMLSFLEDHGASDGVQDRAIVRFLLLQATR